MRIGRGFVTGRNCRIETQSLSNTSPIGPILIIGNHVQLNDSCHISASHSIRIDDHVLIASKVYISDVAHGSYSGDEHDSHPSHPPAERPLATKPVHIHKNVWLGDGVCVLPGVNIGEGSIIGANAVVTANIPAYSIAVGIPARVIKTFNQNSKRWENI